MRSSIRNTQVNNLKNYLKGASSISRCERTACASIDNSTTALGSMLSMHSLQSISWQTLGLMDDSVGLTGTTK